jgi:hypothetical protein
VFEGAKHIDLLSYDTELYETQVLLFLEQHLNKATASPDSTVVCPTCCHSGGTDTVSTSGLGWSFWRDSSCSRIYISPHTLTHIQNLQSDAVGGATGNHTIC